MTEQVFATADKLSKVIKNIQTCLQCMICLHTISKPVKTLCGHRFCNTCIQTVLQNKNASCPLCNSALHRRAISTDEDMKTYIDRLDRLIEAIKIDSGIDISSYLDKPRNTKESHSPITADYHYEENVQPSCSGMNRISKNHEEPRTYSKKKRKNFENNDILKFLSKYSLSGVEPLSAETTNDDQNLPEKDENSKVHSWLNALPETEAFDDPDKIIPEHPAECNLDDTLAMSVSQGCKDNKLEDYEAEEQQQRQSPLRRSLSNNQDKDNEEERGLSRSSETRNHGSKVKLPDEQANSRPTTSGITKSSEECKERSTDVQRTSPCDMLPSMKRNWSSVAQFGKEMRTKKKKKLKSLNVSKSRSHEETTVDEGASKLREPKDARREKESRVPSGVFKDHFKEKDLPRRKSVESREDPEAATSMVRSVIDLRNLEKSLPNVEERRKRVEESIERSNTPINITRVTTDRSDLDKTLPNDEEKNAERLENSTVEESSFIVLEEGEQVRIRNLDSHRMNDIIGIAADDVETRPDSTGNKDQMESTLPLKKRRNMSHTPPSKLPIEAVPNKMTTDRSLSNTMNESTSKCQSVTSRTSNRGRLSLINHNTDRRSNDSSPSNGASRLSDAKRDLNRQIDEGLNNNASKRTMEDNRQEDRSHPIRIEKHKGDRSLVSFKKLGKIFKYGKKRTKFLYLGSTRRESLLSFNVESKYKKPCNFVDYFNTPCYQNIKLETTFGSSIHVTVNDSMMVTEDNIKDLTVPEAEPLTKTKDVSEEATVKQNNPKETVPAINNVQKPCTLDVVIVSNDENDEQPHSLVVSPSQNAMSKSTVKLMSPSNDSQLRYLSFDSPSSFVEKTSRCDRIEAVKVTDHNRDNLLEVKGEHSKALIRKTSGNSDNDSHCDLAAKRKRSKKMSTDEEGDGSKSDCSFSSKTTCIRGSKKLTTRSKDENVLSKSSTKCADVVSLDSDSDTSNSHLEKYKKVYKRIMSPARSDTGSSNLSVKNRKDSTDSPPAKRKRTASPDSDYEVQLESLVNGWCEDLNISDCEKKKSMSKAARAKPAQVYKPLSASNSANIANIHSSQPRHLSEFASKLATEEWDKVVQVDQDSPDFGATIDKIQNIRNSATTSVNGDSKKADTREATITDNFNELNFDTNAFDDYLEAHEIKTAFNRDEPGVTGSSSARSLNKNVMLAHRSSSSDKENKCIGKRMLYGCDSDDDVTMIKDNKSNDKMKALESTSEQVKRISGTSDHEKPAVGLQGNVDDDDLTMKEVDYEQDSLMNVTEHDLLIKQFEEDLFGKPLFSSDSSRLKGQEQKTPQKTNNRNKDTEHSADEDDIVENTPDTKTKNSIREGSVISSSTRSTIPSTPCSRKSIHPLYQSTPKVQQSSSRIECNSAIKPAPINNESSLRRMKTTLGIMNNSKTRKLCFVCSSLILSQVEQVKKLARMMNAKYLTQFEEEVTHVIVKVDEGNNGASKTLKYLQGIAHGKWIVSYQWVIDSLKERKLVNEERYEAVDCLTLEPGPRNSRLRQKGLFEGFAFLCKGPYADVSVEQYQNLLRAAGATVLDSLNDLTAEKSKLKIIMIQADIHDYETIMKWYQKAGAVPIVHEWVVQCISQYKLVSFYPYLQELSTVEVLALGFPDFLVEGEPDEDSDITSNMSM
uniref:breast cancer type 1 susceptibility protein homolog isoform X2 n=1 Tax=Osmia lignaria TaxID=473952 RepID=UPI0014787E82|nr:breast cancer type 1 susceptibility protein homolog isoform X2 [Osmia lignaria]